MNVSVVIPLFNKKDFIVRAIESVLAQKKSVIEIIIVDDGSTDGATELVKKLFGDTVVLYKQTNKGVSSARNKGIELAKSEFIAFLDADDYWHADFINNITFLHKHYPDAGVLCTGYEFSRSDGLVTAKNSQVPNEHGILKNYFLACCNADLPVTASSVCIKRSLLQDVSGFPIDIKIGEDQAVWGTLACMTQIAYHANSSVVYDLEATNSASDVNNKLLLSPHVATFQQLLAQNKVPKHLVPNLKKLIHLSIMSCIKNNLIAGERAKAIALLMNSEGLHWDIYRLVAFGLLVLPKQLIARFYEYARNFR